MVHAEYDMGKGIVYVRIGAAIEELTRSIARDMQISLSEYIRRLVIDDLDERTIFTERIKRAESKRAGDTNG